MGGTRNGMNYQVLFVLSCEFSSLLQKLRPFNFIFQGKSKSCSIAEAKLLCCMYFCSGLVKALLLFIPINVENRLFVHNLELSEVWNEVSLL